MYCKDVLPINDGSVVYEFAYGTDGDLPLKHTKFIQPQSRHTQNRGKFGVFTKPSASDAGNLENLYCDHLHHS